MRLFVHPFAIALFRHKSHHPPHIPRHRQKVHQPPFVLARYAGPTRPSFLPPALCKLCPDSGQRQQCPQLLLLSQAESRANRRVLPEPRAERVRPPLHVRAPFATQAFVSASSPAQHFCCSPASAPALYPCAHPIVRCAGTACARQTATTPSTS